MATGALMPLPWWDPLDDNGLIMPGAKLNFYLSGTSTLATVYHDADLGSAWTQPAVVDAFGRIVVYLDPAVGNLKLIVTDADDAPIGSTIDPLTPANAGASGLGEVWDFGSASSSPITQTTYNVGATYDTLQPGSTVWPVDPATLTGTYILLVQGVQDTSGTLSVSLVNLSDGSPNTPIATATITSLTGALASSAAITFPAGGSVKYFGIKAIVSANTGFVVGVKIMRTV